MFRLSSLLVGAALLLSTSSQANAQFFSPLVDFDSAPLNSAELSQEMFRIPETAPTTSAFIVPNPAGTFTSNAAFRSTELPITAPGSLRVIFEWVDAADANAWVRLQTFNAEVRPYLTEIPIGSQGIAFEVVLSDEFEFKAAARAGRSQSRRTGKARRCR